MASANPRKSDGGTSKAASPTTSGIEPWTVVMIGVPEARASASTYPNCSSQPGRAVEASRKTSARLYTAIIITKSGFYVKDPSA